MAASSFCLRSREKTAARRPHMENAHLRMGKLKFVRQTRDTITEVSLHMDRLVAEKPAEPRSSVQIHLVSVFGGDQEVGAIAAAIADEQRFQISLPGGTEFFGFLGEKPVMYRASLQIPGRKRPVRHLAAVSQTLFGTTLGADGQARRTVLEVRAHPLTRLGGRVRGGERVDAEAHRAHHVGLAPAYDQPLLQADRVRPARE